MIGDWLDYGRVPIGGSRVVLRNTDARALYRWIGSEGELPSPFQRTSDCAAAETVQSVVLFWILMLLKHTLRKP